MVSRALVASAIAIAIFSACVLYGLGGWAYYTTPLADRTYAEGHRWLRPSGYAGHLFGVGGFVLMLVPIAYAVRKKARRLRNAGSIATWLDVHIFCGIVGPVLVTFHTSFKFNGFISVAYWSMVAVALSGFVGRYLYLRIPRSLRGIELTHAELDARATALHGQLMAAALLPDVLARVAAFEERLTPRPGQRATVMRALAGEVTMRRQLVVLLEDLKYLGVESELLHDAAQLIAERASLIRQTAYLEKTRKLFDLWHVFHLPLVYVMFVIVALHIGVTLYMGYIPFVR